MKKTTRYFTTFSLVLISVLFVLVACSPAEGETVADTVSEPVVSVVEEPQSTAEAVEEATVAEESTTDDAETAVATERPYGFAETVVDTEWLAAHLDDPAVRVIEVSVVPGLYERGHIPGAVNFVWQTDFVDTIQRDIVSREQFEQLVRAAGVNEDTTIVLYGDTNNWFAAWAGWIFNVYGAENVRLLDGGRVKWEAEGRELSAVASSYPEGNFVAKEANDSLRVFLPDVLDVVKAESDDVVLVDIRSAAEFDGTIFAPEGFQELAVRAGHIPGAVNVPWGRAVNEDGTIKSVEELRAIYEAVGVDGSKPIIVYCRIGERASHTWYVLSQILGYDVALYDGSWTEWGNTVGVPIANPAGTVWGVQ